MLVCPRCFNAYVSRDRCAIDGARLVGTEPPNAGRKVARFELGRLIEVGRTSRVFQAIDPRTRKDVALKIFHGEIAADKRLAGRLAVAAKEKSKLDRLRFVPVLDADLTAEGLVFIARELSGESLAVSLHHRGARSPRAIVPIVHGAAAALSKLHWAGQVYEDLRPSAIMLRGEYGKEEARLLEPGSLAILKTAPAEVLEKLNGLWPQATYVAPEVVAGEKATTLSDLYVLGVILYELLIGFPPYATARGHIDDPVPAIALDFCGLADLARELLDKNPAKRPQAAAAVLARIEKLGISEPPRLASERRVSAVSDEPVAEKPARRGSAIFAAGGLAIALGAGAYVWTNEASFAPRFAQIAEAFAGEKEPAAAQPAPPAEPPEPTVAVVTEEVEIDPQPAKAAEPEKKAAEPVKKAAEPEKTAAEPVKTAEPMKVAEPVKTAEPMKVAEPTKVAEPAKVDPLKKVVPQQAVAAAVEGADPLLTAYASMDFELGRALKDRGLQWDDLAAVAPNDGRQWGRWFKKEKIPSIEALTEVFEKLKAGVDRAGPKTKTSTPG